MPSYLLLVFPAMASIASAEIEGNRIRLDCILHISSSGENKGALMLTTSDIPHHVIY